MDILITILIIIATAIFGGLGVIIFGVYTIGKMYNDLQELIDSEGKGD